MADGQILVVGGQIDTHVGLPNANLFNPNSETWTALPNMSYPRWYPTATTLPDGRIIVTSGETNCAECDETIQEIYNSSTNSWSQLANRRSSSHTIRMFTFYRTAGSWFR